MMLLCCMNSIFLVENPASSLMFEYCRVKEMVSLLKKVGVKAGVAHHPSPFSGELSLHKFQIFPTPDLEDLYVDETVGEPVTKTDSIAFQQRPDL